MVYTEMGPAKCDDTCFGINLINRLGIANFLKTPSLCTLARPPPKLRSARPRSYLDFLKKAKVLSR